MLKKNLIAIISLGLALLVANSSIAIRSDRDLHRRAMQRLDEGREEMAYMSFRDIVFRFPKSIYLDDSMYYIIRYHMNTRNFFEASRVLKKHLSKFPESKHRTAIIDYAQVLQTKEFLKKAEYARRFNNYELALYYYEEVLKLDPDNRPALKQVENVNKILTYSDYRRLQLQNDKKRIEAESRSIASEMADLERQKLEINDLKQQTEEMDKKTRDKYEGLLEESFGQREALEERVERLMSDLDDWKRRAKKFEARMLLEPNITGLKLVAVTENLPRIIFEGPTTRGLAENERQPEGLLKRNSPSVVLVSEMHDENSNIVSAEFVVSVDLKNEWPKDSMLKLRVDFFNLLADNTPARIARPKIIYYGKSDMDEVDLDNLTYSKKVMVSGGEKQYQKFEVTALFVQ
jgi:tetratricopeptide (TPR) repeat protein